MHFTLTLSRLRRVHQNTGVSQLATQMIDDLIATRSEVSLHCPIEIRVALSGIALSAI